MMRILGKVSVNPTLVYPCLYFVLLKERKFLNEKQDDTLQGMKQFLIDLNH